MIGAGMSVDVGGESNQWPENSEGGHNAVIRKRNHEQTNGLSEGGNDALDLVMSLCCKRDSDVGRRVSGNLQTS